jgi:sugar-phosphatase
VCEDSPAGIAAGKAAGMSVLALTTSYAPERLGEADRIVANLAAVTVEDLQGLSGA